MFWIVFQLGSLIGFIFLGIAAFKLTPDEMNAEAGKFQANPFHQTSHFPVFTIKKKISARFLPT
jgi:hypothetical protein